jgi:O-antigen ligase
VEFAVILYQRYAVHYLVPIPKTVLYPGVPEIWIILSYTVPGTMVNSNAAAAFHLLWLPVLANRALDQRRSAFWTASAVCCLLGIILLNSTSAVLCVLAAAPFIAGPKRVSDWLRRRPGLARAALAGVVSAAAFLILHKIMRTDDGTGHAIPLATKISRLGWWLAGLKMFGDHPFLGVGPGNFPSAFLAYKPGGVPNTLYAHSFPIELLAETGLAGLAGLVYFSAAWFERLRRNRDAVRPRWPFLLGAAAILIYATINIGFEYLANLLGLALFLGVAAAPVVAARWRPTRLIAALTGTLCLTAAAYAAVPFLSSRALVAGDGRLEAGDTASALKSYDLAIQLYPPSAEARQGRARTLYVRWRLTGSREDLQEAAAEEERAIALDKLNASLRGELDVYRKALATGER